MPKVFLVSKTQPDFPTFLSFCKEALGRSVSNLSDSRPSRIDLQRYSLMLSEAIDGNAEYSVLDNLGPVLGLISFGFTTVIHNDDFKDISVLIKSEIIRVDSKVSNYSVLFMNATLKQWRETIIDSLSRNITNPTILDIVASIYDIIRLEGFNRLWNDVDIVRDNRGHLAEGQVRRK